MNLNTYGILTKLYVFYRRFALDIVALIPVVGDVADAANGLCLMK
ncbi:MAG: hypothetical protein WAM41_10460 [Psychrobacillus psychrotolerans]